MGDIEAILERGEYPDAMETFRESLVELETIAAVARRVFNHYGYRGAYADVLVDTIQSMHAATTLTRGDVISLIERGIDEGSTHEVTTAAGVDSVTVQTIHAAKGLEYPIVILANMNQGAFPPRGGDSHEICYADPIGLRQRSIYGTHHDQPYSYGNWRMDVLSTVLPREYDEERRLLYVAMTRAESHLLFAAGDEPNTFLEELPVDIATVEPDLAVDRTPESTQTSLQLPISAPVGPTKYTPHSLMEEINISGGPGRGKALGTMVHNFAEAYARGEAVSPSNADEETIKAYLDECGGTLRIEEDVYLPVTVAGEQVIISGIADLIHVMDDRVEIIDYKTVTERTRESEYRKQLSVYYHVVKDAYPDREVTAGIFYTNTGAIEWIEPLSIADVESVLEAQVESE